MKIDLRHVTTRWINLDRAQQNASDMRDQFERLGFTNHERIPAKIVPVPENIPPYLLKAYGTHFLGCGASHIAAFESTTACPLLILEDDASATAAFTPEIEVPDNTDAVYLGISHGNSRQIVFDMGNGWYKVIGMLASHAILYVSERYRNFALATAKDAIYTKCIPIDNAFAAAQLKFNVLACPVPMFVQSDARQSANKWEQLTSKPLQPTHRSKVVL